MPKNIKDITPEQRKKDQALYQEIVRKSLEERIKGVKSPSAFGTYDSSYGFSSYTYRGTPYEKASKGDRTWYGKYKGEGEWSKFSLEDNPAYRAFSEQGVMELAYDTIVGGLKQAGAGFLDSVASWDLSDLSAVASNKAMNDTGNWLQRQAKSLKDSSASENMIYQDGDDMWNLAYWSMQGQNLGYSVGLVAEMLAEQGILALTTGGTGNVTSLAGLTSRAMKLRPLITQGLHGMSLGIREGYINARETQAGTYEKLLSEGYNPEQAKIYADKAAHIAFKNEVGPLMTINALQNISLFGKFGKMKAFDRTGTASLSLGTSDAVSEVLSKVIPQTKYKGLNKAINFGIVAPIGESIEEVVQTYASKYGEAKVMEQLGKPEEFDFFSTEIRDSAIGGFLGGLVLGAGAKALNKLTGNNSAAFEKRYREFLENSVNRSSNTFMAQSQAFQQVAEAGKAYSENKTEKNLENFNKAIENFNKAEQNSQIANTLNALHLDYIKGKGPIAFEAHVGEMQKILNAVKNNDLVSLKELGILDEKGHEKFEGSLKDIEDNYETYIKDSNFIKDSLEKNLLNVTSDFESAFNVTQQQFYNYKNQEKIDSLSRDIEEILSGDESFNNLSNEGKERFRLESELSAYKKIETAADLDQSSPLNDIDKQRIKEIEERLESLQKYSAQDKLHLSNIEDYKKDGVVSGNFSRISYQHNILERGKKIKDLSKLSTIEANILKRKREALNEANTTEQINEVIQEAENEGVLNKELSDKAKEKIDKIKVKENVGVNPTDPKPVVKPKIQENTETPTQDDDVLSNILSQQDQFLGMEGDFDSGKWFSPRQRNTNPATNASEAALTVKKQIESRLGREATFQDFVDRMIQTKGYDYTEEVYNGLRDAVGAIGVDVSQAQEIYNAYFNADENFAQQVESLVAPKTEQEVARENKEVEQKIQQVTSKKEDYDSNNTPQYTDFNESEDGRTATAAPKAAFNRLDVKRINDTTWEVLSRGLTQDSIIDNNFILDSDYIKPGLQLTAHVRDVDGIPMTEYLPSGTVLNTTWGEYKEKHKDTLKPGTQEYINKVPIVVMDGNTPIFMLHEVSWYNTRNISDRHGHEVQEDIIDRGRKNIARIRQQVVSGNNLLEITADTHFGSIDNLEQHVDKTPSTIQDAAGESSILGVVKVDGDKIDIHTTRAGKFAGITMGLDAVDSSGKPMYKDGDTVDIRWAYNNKEGKPVYMVLKTMNNSPIAPQGNLKSNLPENVVNNSKFAILANIVLSNQNNSELRQALEDRYKITLDKAKKIKDQIKEDTNIDIESNLADYIGMYVQVGYNGMNLEQIGNSELRNGLTYFDTKYRNAEGKVKSTPNRLQVMHKTGNTYEGQIEVGGRLTQGRTVQGTISSIERLFNEESGIFNKAQLSTNLSYLGKKDRIIKDIDANGNFVQDSGKDYNTFLKSNLKTSVLSHKINTKEGKFKWIIDVQPMVYFDLASEVSSVEELPTEVRQEKIKQDLKETVEQILPTEEAKTLEEVTQELTPEQQKELEEFLRRFEDESNNNFNSRWTLTPSQNARLDVLGSNNITGLTTEQNEELVSSLKNSVISSIDFTQHVTIGMLREALETSVEKHIQPKLDNKLAIIQAISKVPNMADKVASLQEEADLLQSILNEKEKLTSISRDNLGSLTKEFNRIFNVNFEEEQVEDSEEVNNEEYSKSFLEKEIKLSYSVGLRLSLFGIPILNDSGNAITNFTGMSKFHSADDIDLKLRDITTSIPSNWNTLISVLQDRHKNRKERVYKQLEEKLTKLPVHLQNELLYKMVSKKLSIFKIINSPNPPVYLEDGTPITTGYNIRVYDENSTKEDLRLRNSIINDFETSDFAMYDDNGSIILNVKHTQIITKALDGYVKDNLSKNTVDAKKLKEIFNKVGLQAISENTIKEYLSKGNNPFQKKKGVLWFINEKLKQLLKDSEEKKIYLTDKDNNLFDNSRKALNKLVNLEIMLNGSFIAKSIRVNDKIMQGIIANTSLYDIVEDLKNLDNSKLYRTLSDNPLTRNNTLLELLQTDERFRESFSVGFSSPDSYKLHGRNNYGKTDFDKLAKQDNLATVLGLYTNTFGHTSLLDPEYKKGLRFRIGQMPVLTLSDKGRMAYITTALLDLKGNDITFNADGTFNIDSPVIKHITQQIFEAELDRIISSYENEHKNIINYSSGAKIFLSLPILNSLTFKGEKIHQYLVDPTTREKLKSGEIREQFINEAANIIQDYLNNKVNEKINVDGTQGQFIDYGIYDGSPKRVPSETSVHNMDTNYVGNKPGKDTLQKLRYTTAEFEINSLLNYSNTYQLFLGDLAFYSKDKTIDKLIGKTVNPTEIAKPEVYSQIAKEVGTIVHKRAASLIAPGFKLANSENPEYGSQEFLHVAINDVEGMSDILKNLIEQQYGKLSPEANQIFNQIIEINKQLETEQDPIEIKRLEEKKDALISNNLSEVQDYFNINGTDAQEYTTWKTHADMLYRQGNLTQQEKELLDSAYEKLSKGKEISSEELQVIMQPVKPVYTGLVPYEGLVRPVYIKSSAFPLLPQITKNLKIDEVRKKLEILESEDENNMVVRMSYQSANKIGALNSQLTMDDLYNKSLDDIRTKLSTATSVLPMSNFKIQQETPSKEDKAYQKGKDSYITMGSQFFKIILGNGINKMTEDVFPNIFPSEVLKMAGVTNKDMLSGEDLDKIYFNVYSEYSKLLMDNLYSELGITSNEDFYNLSLETQNDVIQNLNKILRNEIIERGQPDYLEDSIRLIEEEGLLQTNMPIIFDANRYKFEALMQSIISNRLIVHKLPGNAHISASSEGFTKKEISTLEAISKEDRTGIVWLDNRESGKDLQATVNEDGQIIASEVIIKSHWKVRDEEGNFKYVDLSEDYNEETGKGYSEPIYEDDKLVGRKLLLDKIDPQLLENFSFRIPTSSHQSGVILKVVGFLPQSAGDLLLVPKEHTTQLGEDYDIDKRYIYKSNYYVDSKTGNIKKLVYTDVKEQLDALELMFSEGDFNYDRLVEAITGSNLEEEFFEALEELRDMGLRNESVNSINRIGKRTLNNFKIKMLENSIIDMYKSVYKSPSTKVQQKIFKPLVTDISGSTANNMEQYISQNVDNTYFSILSDSYQRELLKLGADGKAGIGVHSNAVTLEAQMQRLDDDKKIRILLGFDKEGIPIWFEENIGNLHFDGRLGDRSKTLDGGRDIADQHGENQNVSTDNINKQIMGKRNENTYTMSVYAFMAHAGYDLSEDIVDTGINDNKGGTIKEKVHIPSVFINQPILRDYVRLRERYASITSEFVSPKDIDELILNELGLIYNFEPGNVDLPITRRMNKEAYEAASIEMTGQTLWNNLKDNTWDSNIQQAVIQKFLRFQEQARSLSEIQQLINLSTSKLGVSYFEVMQRVSVLNSLPTSNFTSASNLIGKSYPSYGTREHREKYLQYLENIHFEESQEGDNIDMEKIDSLEEEIKETVSLLKSSKSEAELIKEGYKLVGTYWWKPTTIEGVQLINSLKSAQDVMPINFPYNNRSIGTVISTIFENKGVDPTKKSTSSLKWMYEIMSALNDFVSTDVGLFNGNANQERKRLFFNSSSNKALARILKDLKEQNNPIMKNSLLRDLDFKIGLPGSVSIIQHLTDYSSSFDRLSKYEAFKQLVADDSTSLGEFNGEILTPRKLAQDLATYSYLSNTQNGATGFRNYIAIPYLEAIGVTNNYRDTYKSILSGNFDGQLNNFIRQYFQHNPQRATILSKYNQESLEFTPIEGDLSKPDGLQKFTLDNSTADFVSVRNPSIKYSDNQWNLYQNIDGIYHRIDVLGTTGFNEYNAINPNQKSALTTQPIRVKATNTGSEYYNKKTNQWIKIPLIDQVLPLDLGVEGILKVMYNSDLTSQEFKRTIERLQDFVNKDIKIEYAIPKSGSFGIYGSNTNTITISPDIYEQALAKTKGDFNKAVNMVKEVILEEVIHSITVHELKEYIDRTLEDGTVILKDNSPVFATRLVAAFDIAREALPYNPKDITTYYSKNIFEFIAGMYVSPEYRENIESRAPGLIQKFLDAIKRLFSHLSNKYKGEELTYKEEVYSALESLLKTTTEVNTTQEKGIKVNPIEKMKQEDTTQDTPQIESTRVDIGKLSDYTEAPKKTVTDLHGNTYEVYSDEITSYETDFGPLKYITDSNGDMIMLKEPQSTVNNPSQYTNHSGGARGYDAEWDLIGAEFGMINNKHYLLPSDGAVSDSRLQAKGVKPVDATNDVGSVVLQGPATGEAQIAVTNAERIMGRIEPNHTTRNTKKIRNYAQVKNADAIFAIGSLIPKGADITIARGQTTKKALVPQVNGGTSVAVQLGITMGKPTYVFNQVANSTYSQGWYKWDNTKQDFVPIDTPILTKNFAGIGTSSNTTEAGKQAIRDVYENTFNNQPIESSSDDILKNILDQQDNYLGLNPENFNSRYNRYPEIKNCK